MQDDRKTGIGSNAGAWLALAFLLAHAAAIQWLPSGSRVVSFAFLIGAPLLASAACAMAARRTGGGGEWTALALAMLLWAGGMAASMYQEVFLANIDATPAPGMLLFVLYGVPLAYALAGHDHDIRAARAVDGVLALALGVLFAAHTFSSAGWSGADADGYARLRLMFDIENGFLLLFALLRWLTAETAPRRRCFRALSLYALVYAGVAFYINHLDDSKYGALSDVAIGMPFLLLWLLALRPEGPPRRARPEGTATRFIRTAGPLVLPVALLAVSALLLRYSIGMAVAGFAVATLGYGVRSVLLQLRAAQERDRLDALARVDALTGLANRRQFDDILRNEWSRARRSGLGLALLLLDIDHFKLLNDRLGHPAGDAALRQVAQALLGCVHRAGDVVARYGGEEFAAVLPGMPEADALRMAERMRSAVAALGIASPAPAGKVTISVGVAVIARAGAHEPLALLHAADAALYEAKRQGRDRVMQGESPDPGKPLREAPPPYAGG